MALAPPEQLQGATVKLKLRAQDFTTLTRQTTLSHPTDDAQVIESAVIELLDKAWDRLAVRLIGVGVTG